MGHRGVFHGTTEPLREKDYMSWHFRVSNIVGSQSSHQPAVKLFNALPCTKAQFPNLVVPPKMTLYPGINALLLFPFLTFNLGIAPACIYRITNTLHLRFYLCSSHSSQHPGLQTFFHACLCTRLAAP